MLKLLTFTSMTSGYEPKQQDTLLCSGGGSRMPGIAQCSERGRPKGTQHEIFDANFRKCRICQAQIVRVSVRHYNKLVSPSVRYSYITRRLLTITQHLRSSERERKNQLFCPCWRTVLANSRRKRHLLPANPDRRHFESMSSRTEPRNGSSEQRPRGPGR